MLVKYYMYIHISIYRCWAGIYNTSKGPSWSWSYGSWNYNYLCNQCLSPLMLWVRISIRARCTTLCDKICQWLAAGRFSTRTPVSPTNKTDSHDITEIVLKVALNTIIQTNHMNINLFMYYIWPQNLIIGKLQYIFVFISL